MLSCARLPSLSKFILIYPKTTGKKNKEGLIPSFYWSYIQYPNKPSWFCFKIYILFSSYSLFSNLAVTSSVKVISISQLRQWKISHSWSPYFHSFPYCSFSHNSQSIFSVYLNQIILLTWWDLGILTILSRLPPTAQETLVCFVLGLTFQLSFICLAALHTLGLEDCLYSFISGLQGFSRDCFHGFSCSVVSWTITFSEMPSMIILTEGAFFLC